MATETRGQGLQHPLALSQAACSVTVSGPMLWAVLVPQITLLISVFETSRQRKASSVLLSTSSPPNALTCFPLCPFPTILRSCKTREARNQMSHSWLWWDWARHGALPSPPQPLRLSAQRQDPPWEWVHAGLPTPASISLQPNFPGGISQMIWILWQSPSKKTDAILWSITGVFGVGRCFSKLILEAFMHRSVIANHRKHDGDLLGSPVLLKGFLAPSCGEWDPFSENQRGALKTPAHLQGCVSSAHLYTGSHIFLPAWDIMLRKKEIFFFLAVQICCVQERRGMIQDVQDCWVSCALITAKFPKCFTKIHLFYRKYLSSS